MPSCNSLPPVSIITGPRYVTPIVTRTPKCSSRTCPPIHKSAIPPRPVSASCITSGMTDSVQSSVDAQQRIMNGLQSVGWDHNHINGKQLHVYDSGYMSSKVRGRRVNPEMLKRGLVPPPDVGIWLDSGRRLNHSSIRDKGLDMRHIVFETSTETQEVIRDKAKKFMTAPNSPFPPNPYTVSYDMPRGCEDTCVSDGGRGKVCQRRRGIFGQPVGRGTFMLTPNSSLDTMSVPTQKSDSIQAADITARISYEMTEKMASFEDSIVNAHRVTNFRRYPARLPPNQGPGRYRPYQFDSSMPNLV